MFDSLLPVSGVQEQAQRHSYYAVVLDKDIFKLSCIRAYLHVIPPTKCW